jgi:hydrogenase expression/formation protein HypD
MNNFIDEFRNSETAVKMAKKLSLYEGRHISLMEVCGTHTMSIFRHGIKNVLPENISLISGPGCPVCVTPVYYVDTAVKLSRRDDVIITTFGDMMRIPGSESSLLKEKALGRNIRMVYSPLDSLKVAHENPDKKVVFLSVGFETTTPVVALAVTKALEENLNNFYILSSNKTMPEALELLASDEEISVDGFIYPGHVTAITGTEYCEELCHKYSIPGVVAGFEPLDILRAIITLAESIDQNTARFENQYSRVVKKEGNPLALEMMYNVFEKGDSVWRGLGLIPASGLCLKEEYSRFDAWKVFGYQSFNCEEPKGCICGEVLKGKKTPMQCGLFGTRCTPENPVGACMVSSEGTCSAYYKYGGM